MSIEVRPISEAELRPYLRCLRTAFLGEPEVPDQVVEWWSTHIDWPRALGAFTEGALSGTAGSFPVELTVPGGHLPAAAVTQVSVLPTRTRRGLLRAMMDAQLRDVMARGEPLAILLAAEWSIYGRFGYGPATEKAGLEVETDRAAFNLPPTGGIELVETGELRALAVDIYDRARAGLVGAISRDDVWWDVLSGRDPVPGSASETHRVRAVWNDQHGEPQGYVIYEAAENWVKDVAKGRITVHELVGATDQASRELWRYLCGIDLVTTVRAEDRPVDDPLELQLVDGRAVRQTDRTDHMWLRVLDIPGAMSIRRYAASDRLVLDVSDPTLGRGGRFSLEGGRDFAEVGPTTATADLSLDIGALGAAYLGGTSFAALAAAGRVEEVTPGAIGRIDTMFSQRPAPFLTTNF